MPDSNSQPFRDTFRHLTGHAPFPWQTRLYQQIIAPTAAASPAASPNASGIPGACCIPTGVGKTLIVAVWLIAVAEAPTLVPRRLVYVVNRRTVVDQATREVERLRANLAAKPELQPLAEKLKKLCAVEGDGPPLAISTLRGQFADNAEWRSDPARPSVVVGTVDMIGSRLLFNGYGCGFKSRPLHAGFLGQDALLVHDEAHLEPAFQELIHAVQCEQRKHAERARYADFRPFHVIELTATSRANGTAAFGLGDDDHANEIVQKRINARKRLAFHVADEDRKIAEHVAKLALDHKASEQAILVYQRKLEDVEKVANELRKKKQQVQVLTGTMRGFERDGLATSDPIFARFLPPDSRGPNVIPATGSVFLVCTSAGEVGVNISADHLVCDLTPFDSMAQRFGRVNRFGDGDARIDVVVPTAIATDFEAAKADAMQIAIERTYAVLQRLPETEGRRDASPAALSNLPADARQAAFSPPPTILPVSDMLFDAWALTSIRDALPGRPAVADWLHGITSEPPETHVAWREEIDVFRDRVADLTTDDERREFEEFAAGMLEDYPLKPHEMLRDRTDRVFATLAKLAVPPETPVWVVASNGTLRLATVEAIISTGKDALANLTVVLPPSAGCLNEGGVLDANAAFDATQIRYDVADFWFTDDTPPRHRRQRIWNDETPQPGMRLVREFIFDGDSEAEPGEDEAAEPRIWRWYVRPRSAEDDAGSWRSTGEQELEPHLTAAEMAATRLVDKLEVPKPMRSAVIFAARHHDRGKHRELWQRAIGNRQHPQRVLAKSAHARRPDNLSHYRHEFGSLLDVRDAASTSAFADLPSDVQELALHLIAAHHGRARPMFSVDEAFDPERPAPDADQLAVEVPQRFARLQRQYGRWGLAFLESLVRAADILASQSPSKPAQAPAEDSK